MRQFRRTFTVALGAALVASGALADEVLLRGGGRMSGVVVERTATAVVIETGPGRVTLPISRVERIVEGRSTLVVFRGARRGDRPRRRARLGRARPLGCRARSRDAVARAPGSTCWRSTRGTPRPTPRSATFQIGRTLDVGRRRLPRARLRPVEGRWLTPAEHEAAVRERAADQMAEFQAREADMRVREAEARAREAEARAREAESGADYSADGGIPYYPYVFGGGYAGGYPGYPGYGPRPPHVRPPGMGPGRPGPRHPNGGMRPVPQPTPGPKPAPEARAREALGGRRRPLARPALTFA